MSEGMNIPNSEVRPPSGEPAPVHPARGPLNLLAWVLVFTCIGGLGVREAWRDRQQQRELAASRDQMTSALAQSQAEIQALRAKLDALDASREAPPAHPSKAARKSGGASAGRTRQAGPLEDARLRQMQAQLSRQREQIASTQKALSQTREDMENKLNSTRDDLSGSIARNHEELVLLEKRGERNYDEFHITKSKQFQRVGPLSLSLRKTNTKRKSYDLAMIVDDVELQKKGVNLYEPILINLSDRPQPLELVVNKITKNEVSGYLSEPKYKKSELAAASSPAAGAQTPGLQPRRDSF